MLILVFATIVRALSATSPTRCIILAIIAVSGLLGFWQERGATQAVDALLAVVQVKVEVARDGTGREVPLVDSRARATSSCSTRAT